MRVHLLSYLPIPLALFPQSQQPDRNVVPNSNGSLQSIAIIDSNNGFGHFVIWLRVSVACREALVQV
jgi:hypothetical protein